MSKRSAVPVLVVLGLLWLYSWPKIVMLRCLEGDARALAALRETREKVLAYRQEHGRFPADLAEVGVPSLDLYSYDAGGDRVHRHRRIAEVDARPNLAAAREVGPEDAGKWLYDPRTGLVVLGCSGTDTKHRRPWYLH